MMEKSSIINGGPPANYGRVKRALFNLGIKAYRNPKPSARILYNSMANMAGIPLWCAVPGYDFGGIRKEIQRSLKSGEEKPFLIEAGKIYGMEETWDIFRLTGKENTDPRMLRLAIKNLVYYRGDRSKEAQFLFASAMLVGIFAFSSVQAFLKENDFQRGFPLGLFALGLLRISSQIAVEFCKTSDALLKFIFNTDKEILIEHLPSLAASPRILGLLRKTYWKQIIADPSLLDDPSHNQFFEAINSTHPSAGQNK